MAHAELTHAVGELAHRLSHIPGLLFFLNDVAPLLSEHVQLYGEMRKLAAEGRQEVRWRGGPAAPPPHPSHPDAAVPSFPSQGAVQRR